MPTIASSKVPPPKSWDEFEDITLDAAKLRWGSDEFFRYGRSGQAQQGVDVWGHDEEELVGIQCKNTVSGLTLDIVNTEIQNAEAFDPKLDRLYIATTAARDATLQRTVRQISASRRQARKFRVSLLFWDDVCGDLAGDDRIFFKHYPQFGRGYDAAKQHDKKLFDELTSLLKTNGIIGFLDKNNMAGFAYREENFEPLREFYYEWNAPERHFLTPELDEIRSKLWKCADSYTSILASETFPLANPSLSSIPQDWEIHQPKRFWKAVNSLHELAGQIVELHKELIQTGKRILL